MLSILIPTYNYNAYTLVSAMHEQASQLALDFEIICLDDASTIFFVENDKINALSNARYERLQQNIGRSKIRNLLATQAKFDWLLFLDADVFPKSPDFLKTYLSALDSGKQIINGGQVYQNEKPEQRKLLRWVYGKNREALTAEQRQKNPYLGLLTLNFIIHKSVFDRVRFNEDIPNLRHEDTLFSFNLMEEKISILHIENPIIHLGLDDFENMIRKEKESLTALKFLIDNELLPPNYLRISTLFDKLKKRKLINTFAAFHQMTQSAFLSQLSGKFPSLLLYDLYRIGYLCSIENQNR